MERNGVFYITNRKIEISIKKDAFNKIENYRNKYLNDIKFFNTYDNDKLIFIQIYFKNDLTLERYTDLKEIGLQQKSIYIDNFKNELINENELPIQEH